MSNISRIFPLKKRPPKELLDQFKNVPTSFVSDNMKRLYGSSYLLKPFHSDGQLLGTAFTVKTRPGDNLLVHKAIDIAKTGDVLVIDAGGETANAIIGENMVKMAIKNNLAGFVIDGAIRDSKEIKNNNFPVYARGVTHLGPYKDGPGDINVPVNICGMIINPGDIILGDDDGIIAISLDEAEKILPLVKKTIEFEVNLAKEIKEGTLNKDWIDETLKRIGCKFYE